MARWSLICLLATIVLGYATAIYFAALSIGLDPFL